MNAILFRVQDSRGGDILVINTDNLPLARKAVRREFGNVNFMDVAQVNVNVRALPELPTGNNKELLKEFGGEFLGVWDFDTGTVWLLKNAAISCGEEWIQTVRSMNEPSKPERFYPLGEDAWGLWLLDARVC